MAWWLLLCCGAVVPTLAVPVTTKAPRPHIISILQDDLGWHDSGIHNPEAEAWSGNITSLAKEGVVLNYHYSHWHCSPSRRSFLTGRLPIHHGEQLSPTTEDDIDLRMTWVSDKLAQAGYKSHWFGKYHTGFRSMNHLPISHNFSHSMGSLQTGGNYGAGHTTRWQEDHPVWTDSQFSDRPSGCDSHSESSSCDPSTFKSNTKLPCGEPITFTNATSATQCCADCGANPGCTHWVYNPNDVAHGPCHIKGGVVTKSCAEKQEGVTSGVSKAPSGATCANEYSTDLWGQLALQAVTEHDPSTGPLYVHLCYQAVHTPYDKAPGDPTGNVYRGMLWRADVFVGQLVTLLKAKGMWENTVLVYSSDNGGTVDGNNYPLRGEKHSNWEGGMRTAAFVSGGFLPKDVRGTRNNVTMHLADWYPTFCNLAGVSPKDDPPVPPLTPDPAHPLRDLYGEHSYPPVDGVDLWPILTAAPGRLAMDAAHKELVLTKEVVIAGRYKLLVSQPHFKTQQAGWKQPDGKWRNPEGREVVGCQKQDVAPAESALPVVGHAGTMPCLFDLLEDPGEHDDLSASQPELVQQLWSALNVTVAGQRDCSGWSYKGTSAHIPGPKQPDGTTSCSPPELLGKCDATCAGKRWESYGNSDGPICGVPGCV